MVEKIGVPNVEQQKIDPEKIWKKLTAIPETPGALRKTLLSANVQQFMKIMTSPRVVELDWFVLCGDMDAKQAAQYMIATGDYYICSQELTDLALKISDYYKPELVKLIENDIRGYKKEGIYNLLYSLLDLCKARLESIKDLPVGSMALADRFFWQSMAFIGSDLIDIKDDPKVNEKVKIKIDEIIEFCKKNFKAAAGTDFPGIYYHYEKNAYRETFEKNENIESIDKIIGFTKECESGEQLKIKKENERLFAVIKKEALYKKIPLVTLNDENPQIIAMGDHPYSGHKFDLCNFFINFQKVTIDSPALQINQRGSASYDFRLVADIVNCNMNPATGDLCFVSSPVPLNQIMSEDRYFLLQNYLLHKLKDYLESKEPDVEDLFTYSPSELEAREEKIEADEEVIQMEEAPSELIQEPAEAPPEAEKILEGKLSLPKNVRVMIMDKISSARAEEVLAALRRMFGKEEKTKGSHLFFRSDRNGKILPVPRHSQKDQHHISLPLILDNLRSWQYDPIELAMELGLKVPKRLLTNES